MIALFGPSGQLGRALRELFDQNHIPYVAVGSDELDFRKCSTAKTLFENIKPTLVINAAAYTQVDLAESDRENAFAVNAEAPGIIAECCAKRKIPFIHYSTDYVFNGSGNTPWKETDSVQPLNEYGRSKAKGEQQILESGAQSTIIRSSWIYSVWPRNFLLTMISLARTQEELKIVNDQWGAPTYAEDLAAATLAMIRHPAFSSLTRTEIFHVCSSGSTTWFQFANAIFDQYRAAKLGREIPLKAKNIIPLKSADFLTKAVRPLNSRMDTRKFVEYFGYQLPSWQDGLERCVERLSSLDRLSHRNASEIT